MNKTTENISDALLVHKIDTIGKEDLNFYNDEIQILRSRLEEIASKNTNKELLAQVEHFQNQLIIQKEKLDELKHDFSKDEIQLALQWKTKGKKAEVETKRAKDLYDQLEIYEKIFNELRHEMNEFFSRTF